VLPLCVLPPAVLYYYYHYSIISHLRFGPLTDRAHVINDFVVLHCIELQFVCVYGALLLCLTFELFFACDRY